MNSKLSTKRTHLPFRLQLRVRQDGLHDTCTVHWRVRVVRSYDGAQLRSDVVQVLGVLAHDRQVTDTFVVETEVLGETLRTDHLDASGDEVANGICVLVQIAAREAFQERTSGFVVSWTRSIENGQMNALR